MAMGGIVAAVGSPSRRWWVPLRETILGNQVFWIALLLAITAHALIVFGVDFDYETDITPRQSAPTLDLVLTHKRATPTLPAQADFLAQQSQDGRASQEPVPELIEATDSVQQIKPVAIPVQPAPVTRPPQPATPPKPVTEPAAKPRPIKQAKPKPVQRPKPDAPLDMRAVSLMSRSLAMAKLGAVVDEQVNDYAAMPRERHISARTREFKYANYMLAWVKKVERVGNLNYPEEARKKNLTGRLILDVSLNPEGEVTAINFLKRSGHDTLDQAAERIVRAAAPFAPFPTDIRKETDVLHITRTWHFLTGNRLSGE